MKNIAKVKKINYKRWNFIIAAVAFLINGILLRFLPKEIPMQWANDGSVAYTLPSVIGVWILPCILLFLAIQYASKRKYSLISTAMLFGLFIINCIVLSFMIGA